MNIVNWKIYVGQTINLERRWKHHLQIVGRPSAKGYQLIHKAISKYGKGNFSFTLIQTLSSEKEALDCEKYWIDFYQTNTAKYGSNAGYNQTDGGDGHLPGIKLSQITKDKISKAKIGIKIKQEFNDQRSIYSSGIGNPMYGKHHTKKSKNTISNTRKLTGVSKGENNSKAKLNESQVREIKLMLKTGKKQKDIAKLYNVWPSAIQKIASGLNWGWIIV